jgi:TonB family protein
VNRVTRALLRSAIIGFFAVTAAGAQSIPLGAKHMAWENLDIVVAPDSAGAVLWAGMKTKSGYQSFSAPTLPRDVEAWAAAAHDFLALPLADADTGDARVTRALRGICGEVLYLMRRRNNGSWSNERFLVLKSPRDSQPLTISGTKDEIGLIVTSLAVAAGRSPYNEEAAKRVASEEKSSLVIESPPSAKRSNRPPRYPSRARQAGQEGLVLLTFIVGEDGKVAPGSDRLHYATDASFLAEVQRALPSFRFDPARKDGKPIPLRVAMPFMFSLFVPRG